MPIMPSARRLLNTGVYAIRNKINGKVYVGSAAGRKGFSDRWKEHRCELRVGNHCNSHLQAAWNKYGEKSFEFLVLIRCLPKECVQNEQQLIDDLYACDGDFGYNQCPTAGNMLGFKFSKESRARISKRMSGNKHRLGKESPFKGKTHSEESKKKMSLSRKGRKISEEWKANLSASLKGRPKSPETKAKMRVAQCLRRQKQRLGGNIV